MQRAFMLSVSAVVMICAAAAAAQLPPPLPPPTLLSLTGTYGATGTTGCLTLVTPAQFNSVNSGFLASGTSSNSTALEELWTFNGDGTGTAKGSTMGINIPPPPELASASSSNTSFSFTYTVNADRSFTLDTVPGTSKGTVLTGGRAGQTFSVDNLPTLTGLISRNGNTLTLATLTPGVNTITYSNNTGFNRVCHSSRVFTKL